MACHSGSSLSILLFALVLLGSGSTSVAARHLLADAPEAPPLSPPVATYPKPTLPPMPSFPKPTLPPMPAIPAYPKPTTTFPPIPAVIPSIPKPTFSPLPEMPKFTMPPMPSFVPSIPKMMPSIPKVTIPGINIPGYPSTNTYSTPPPAPATSSTSP